LARKTSEEEKMPEADDTWDDTTNVNGMRGPDEEELTKSFLAHRRLFLAYLAFLSACVLSFSLLYR